MSSNANPASVEFRQIDTASGHVIGVARLNSPQSLNALSLAMIRLLDATLREWVRDPRVACIVMQGAGEKAFCAGGDVRSLHSAILEHESAIPNPSALEFFSEEYRLDHRIHTCRKPVLVWGSGIVIGGGMGLLSGASHRVVTETSRIAMPEITIGLFPDVAGSWFLQHMPGHMGLFVALTGAMLNGHDAVVSGLADYFLKSSDRDAVIECMVNSQWHDTDAANRELLSSIVRDFDKTATIVRPPSNLLREAGTIEELCAGDTLGEVLRRFADYTGTDEWIRRGIRTLAKGSPTSAALIWELRERSRDLALADIFRMECIVALQCCAHPDFPEGVRALLIDKDNEPRWTPAKQADVSAEWVEEHFAPPPWPQGKHPLGDL
ncbi:MAG: enoyl-CoA hydratase/isomerase family protein [Steroidobacteraceae bacterium]